VRFDLVWYGMVWFGQGAGVGFGLSRVLHL
jgi:hypothetical protein